MLSDNGSGGMWLSDVQSIMFTDSLVIISLIFVSLEIGVGLCGFGILFMLLGCMLFFDRGLIALGNLMFVSGLVMVIGVQKAGAFFMRPRKWRGTVAFILGIALVLLKMPLIGMAVELFGFINLFGFLRRLPVIGNVLNLPILSEIVDQICGSSKLPV